MIDMVFESKKAKRRMYNKKYRIEVKAGSWKGL